jgi:hypothetical protein
MTEGQLGGILGEWTRCSRTALPQGLNSLFRGVKLKTRGCSKVEHATAMLYLVAGKITIPY